LNLEPCSWHLSSAAPLAALLLACGAGTLPGGIDPPDGDSDVDADVDTDSDSDADDMVRVPEGEFGMGCVEDLGTGKLDCQFGDTEPHDVWLSAFEIDRTEVTQAAYSECVEAGVCETPACEWDPAGKPNYPVACIDRSQASVFCEWRSASLPTEAQWEKAARGTDGRRLPFGTWYDVEYDDACEVVNSQPCADYALPVDGRPLGASPYGALDMAGNVTEWVQDWYDGNYYPVSPDRDPPGPDTGTVRVGRGGCFVPRRTSILVFNRDPLSPDAVEPWLGFRCAR